MTEPKGFAAARRKARELVDHCAFYGIPVAVMVGADVDMSTIDPEHFGQAEFEAWRKRMGWSHKKAAEELDISLRMAKYYSGMGRTATGPAQPPKAIALACESLETAKGPARRSNRALHADREESST